MATVILLSSSPPRVFARSPTPVASSPGLASPGALIRGESPGRSRFKTTSATRDRFPSGLSAARPALAVQHGAENKSLPSPRRNRFRLSQPDSEDVAAVCQASVTTARGGMLANEHQEQHVHARPTVEFRDPEGPTEVQIKASDVKRRKVQKKKNEKADVKPQSEGPLLIQRTMARRLDWTPPKDNTTAVVSTEILQGESNFPTGILEDYEYCGELRTVPTLDSNVQPTKRRKLNFESDRPKLKPASTVSGRKKSTPKATGARGKSPVKKGLTITGLATSKFFDLEEPETTPMMQYLVSTQAEMQETLPDAASLQDKVKQTKVDAKKLKGSRGIKPKSRLVSPSSAMRSFEQQDTIFGSASQLARDESPSFLRDLVEATKQSEASFLHDFSSPQRTQPISIESTTPKEGTLRFRRTRNLWAAAGRTEDNALLHIDSVDLVDSPDMRNVFTGKDVMVQPSFKSTTVRLPAMNDGQSPLLMSKVAVPTDIDDIVTPAKDPSMQRPFSTSAAPTSARQSVVPESEQPPDVPPKPLPKKTTVAAKSKKAPPKKPNYAGFTDNDLKKQISAYGFKAIKKREKMVELLDKCWEEKNGSSEPPIEQQAQTSGYGDILSHVHDVLARPVPKTKKPRAPRKKKDEGTAEKPVQTPRQRKKKAEEDPLADPAKKPPRKRKTKANALSEEVVHDIEDIDTVSEQPSKQLETRVITDEVATNNIADQPPTPPPSGTPDSDTPLATIRRRARATAKPTTSDPTIPTPQSVEPSTATQPAQPLSTSPNTPQLAPIQDQITRAIFHQSKTSRSSHNTNTNTTPKSKPKTKTKTTPNIPQKRNHQTNPTWHEKILLYDPIVLEDLATWLNTEGMRAIEEDREVSALEVRTWCESRGICCLWRGGWRGQKGAGASVAAATGE